MKQAKKYVIALIIIASLALMIIRLFGNKKQIDNELKAMSEYSSVIPVEVIYPRVQQPVQTIEENGVLRSRSEITLLSETSGKITYVAGNPGERVITGQTLVEVEHDVIESQFDLARTSLKNAERDLARFNIMAGGEAITQQQLETAQLNYMSAFANYTSLEKQFANTVIKSPVNGIIARRFVETGSDLTLGMQVFSILPENRTVLVINVSEQDIQQIKKGDKAIVSLDVVKEKAYTGMVHSIGVVPDMSGRYEVEIRIANHDGQLRPGMSGKALFDKIIAEQGLVIPRKCIVGSIHNASIFILKDDMVLSRKVKAVSINETDALITEGLSSDEKVVLSGQINLLDSTRVKVTNQ